MPSNALSASSKIASPKILRSSPHDCPTALWRHTSAASSFAISNGDSSGMRAWSRPRSTRPSQVRPPVGPLSMLASPSSSDSKIVLGELRHGLQIAERRHGADARLTHILAAELHRQCIGRPERMTRIVAGGAGHPAGGRERRIGEQRAAERGERRCARIGLRARQTGLSRLCRNAGGDEHDAQRARQQDAARETECKAAAD